MSARAILVVELPTPPGREDEWNAWYHQVHIPDVLRTVPGAIYSARYRLVAGENDVRYLVIHEFSDPSLLVEYVNSPLAESLRNEYEQAWGTKRAIRRRAFTPIFEEGLS